MQYYTFALFLLRKNVKKFPLNLLRQKQDRFSIHGLGKIEKLYVNIAEGNINMCQVRMQAIMKLLRENRSILLDCYKFIYTSIFFFNFMLREYR